MLNSRPAPSTANPSEVLVHMHARMRKYWQKHGADIKVYWSGLSPDARTTFIKTIQPMTPISLEKPYFEHPNGDPEMIHATPLIADSTLEALSKEQGLLELFEYYSEAEHVADYALSTVHYVRDWEKRGHCFRRRPQPGKQSIVSIMREDFGSCLAAKNDARGKKAVEEILKLGGHLEENVFETMLFRLNGQIMMLCSFIDEYETEVLGSGTDNKIGRAQLGCNNCSRVCRPDGRSLLQCSVCKFTCYCSAECQKKDWKAHKKVCKDIVADTFR
jgi:hypothetical protein